MVGAGGGGQARKEGEPSVLLIPIPTLDLSSLLSVLYCRFVSACVHACVCVGGEGVTQEWREGLSASRKSLEMTGLLHSLVL